MALANFKHKVRTLLLLTLVVMLPQSIQYYQLKAIWYYGVNVAALAAALQTAPNPVREIVGWGPGDTSLLARQPGKAAITQMLLAALHDSGICGSLQHHPSVLGQVPARPTVIGNNDWRNPTDVMTAFQAAMGESAGYTAQNKCIQQTQMPRFTADQLRRQDEPI